MKRLFQIEYIDPDTQHDVVVIKEFEDAPDCEVRSPDGRILNVVDIDAKSWANDWAYSAADKGAYNVTEIVERATKVVPS